MTVNQSFLLHRSTYLKGSTLLYTSATRYIYYQAWYEGVVQTTNFSAATGDTSHLFSFSSSNNPTIDTALSPPRLFLARQSPKLTPPGDGVFMRGDFAGDLYLRDNGAGTYQSASSFAVNSNDTWGAWSDNAGELLLPDTSAGGLISFTSINWAAGTFSRNATKYNAIPGAGVNALGIVRNGAVVDDRCYVYNLNTGQLGWVHTGTGAYTSVVDYVNAPNIGVLCADNYLGSNPRIAMQRGVTNEGNNVDIYDTTGALVATINLPAESTTVYSNLSNFVFDYVNNYLWCKAGSSADRVIYVFDLNNYTIRDIYAAAELPSGTSNILPVPALGSPAGGIYAIHAPAGTYTQMYKLG